MKDFYTILFAAKEELKEDRCPFCGEHEADIRFAESGHRIGIAVFCKPTKKQKIKTFLSADIEKMSQEAIKNLIRNQVIATIPNSLTIGGPL